MPRRRREDILSEEFKRDHSLHDVCRKLNGRYFVCTWWPKEGGGGSCVFRIAEEDGGQPKKFWEEIDRKRKENEARARARRKKLREEVQKREREKVMQHYGLDSTVLDLDDEEEVLGDGGTGYGRGLM